MNKVIPKCAFAKTEIRGLYRCIAITADKCNGFDRKCSFYKSEDRHISDMDKAIDICRKKGICKTCKYQNGNPCKKSTEGR
ncbi:MAG: hypothetical protein K2K89_05875 [Ruminococcus sp.]|nr:hypothetical protein [Ruminococcus sp.]